MVLLVSAEVNQFFKIIKPTTAASAKSTMVVYSICGCFKYRLAEAPSFGKPVILYDANSKGSVNYLNLAKEILQKNNMTKIPQEERTIEL